MITIPPYVGASNIALLMKLSHDVINYVGETIDCDATSLRFIDPLGLCVLASVCHHISESGKNVVIHNLSDNMKSYMARMDLFDSCNIENIETYNRNDKRDSLVEVCKLENASQIDQLSTRIAHAIVGEIPDIDPNEEPDEMTGYTALDQLVIPIEYMFSELLENALTHGKRSGFRNANVWVSAQYYPKRDVIQLAVVDNGCGYLNTLNTHPELISPTHIGAIQTALLPEVSCNNDVNLMGDSINQGIGLTVVKDLALRAEGSISIISGDALLFQSENTIKHSSNDDWQGVITALEIPRDNLKSIKIHEVIRPYQPSGDVPDINFE